MNNLTKHIAALRSRGHLHSRGHLVREFTRGLVVRECTCTHAALLLFACLLFITPLSNAQNVAQANKNYRIEKVYDEDGNVLSYVQVYLDKLGRTEQVQTKDLANNRIVVQQTVYDEFGRPAIQSLPAPVYTANTDNYQGNFMQSNAGTPSRYTAADFDKPINTGAAGEIENPNAVNQASSGSLGWYYSNNNNQEAYVPASAYPYQRTVYADDVRGRVLRTAAAGEELKMGSGHDRRMFFMNSSKELQFITGEETPAYKSISIDEEGLTQITYSRADGKTIAQCFSGLPMATGCLLQRNVHYLRYTGTPSKPYHSPNTEVGFVDVHVPAAGSLKLIENSNLASNHEPCSADFQMDFVLIDLLTGKQLVEGSSNDYVIDSNDEVEFKNDYDGIDVFLRIRITHDQDYHDCMQAFTNLSAYPLQTVEVTTDYSEFNLYQYNNDGLLTAMYPPSGIDCNNYDPNIASSNTGLWNNGYLGDANGSDEGEGYEDYAFQSGTFSVGSSSETQRLNLRVTISAGGASVRDGMEAPACDYVEEYFELTPGGANEYSGGSYDDPANWEEGQYAENFDWNDRTDQYAMPTYQESEGQAQLFIDAPEEEIEYFTEYEEYFAALGDVLDSTQAVYALDGQSYDQSGELSQQAWKKWNGDLDSGTYCVTEAHCFNDVQDCDETGVDIGGVHCGTGNTPPPGSCYGKNLRRRGTFKITLKAQAKAIVGGAWSDQNLFEKRHGNDMAYSITKHNTVDFYVELKYDCRCMHRLVVSGIKSVDVNLDNGFLANYNQVRFEIASIQFASNWGNGPLAFRPFNANDPYEDMIRKVIFNTQGNHVTGPKVSAPSHITSKATTYAYNFYNQPVTEDAPDAGKTEYVYDSQHRLKFWQTASQAVDDKFSYIDYDANGRIVERGVAISSGSSMVQFQNEAASPSLQVGYTSTASLLDQAFGATAYSTEEVHQVEYDSEGSSFPSALSGYTHAYLKGKVSKTANDESSTWYGYDQRGRLSWTVQEVADLQRAFTVNYSYNKQGNLESLDFQKETAAERMVHHYSYDANGRLINIKTSRDGVLANAVQHAAYAYYQHGASKRTELGDDLQGIDLVYTINGRLKSINNPVTARDPGADGQSGAHSSFAQDIFGMTLDYYRGDYVRLGTGIQTYSEHSYDFISGNLTIEPSQYNGNIQGIRWRTRSEVHTTSPQFEGSQLIYMPKYDARHRLVSAKFGTISSAALGIQNTTTPPQANVFDGPSPLVRQDYKLWDVTYDTDGNMNQLKRNAYTAATLSMDQLTFNRSGNQLTQVTDAVAAGNYSTDIDGQAVANYSYDASGRMISDVAGTNYLDYNSDNLVKTVYDQSSKTASDLKAQYGYDERGQRLFKTTYDPQSGANTFANKQYYIRDVNGVIMAIIDRDESSFPATTTATEMPIYGSGQLGFYNKDNNSYRYQLSDHLGNVRATIARNKDGNGEVQLLGMQDYYPFGSEMPGRSITGSFVYEQGYQGQAKDGETGFNNFQLRLYDSRIGGWLSPDPYKQHFSPYMAMSNNPLSFIDPDGGWDGNANGWNVDDSDMPEWKRNYYAQGWGGEAGLSAAFGSSNDVHAGNLGYEDQLAWSYQQSKGNFSSYYGGFDKGILQYNMDTRGFGYYEQHQEGGGSSGPTVIASNLTEEDWFKLEVAAMLAPANPLKNVYVWVPIESSEMKDVDFNTLWPAILGGTAAYVEKNMGLRLKSTNKYNFVNPPWKPSTASHPDVIFRTKYVNITMPRSAANNLVTSVKVGGYALGAYNAYAIRESYIKGEIGLFRLGMEQGSNAYATLGGLQGAAWGIGWEIGRTIVNTNGYQRFRANSLMPFRKKVFGY